MIHLVVIAAVIAVTAAPAAAAERRFPVGDFSGIALAGSPNVTVVTGPAASVRASGSDAALDRLEIGVDGGTLKIGTKRGLDWSWRDYGRVTIAVTVPMLRAVDVGGSGDVVVDRVKSHDFTAAIAGSGSIRVGALDADLTNFSIAGSGSVTAAGRCSAETAKIRGSGDLKLSGLKCMTLSANIAGSGAIDAYATQTATLAMMGSGDIRVTGGARCTVSSTGSGKAHCS